MFYKYSTSYILNDQISLRKIKRNIVPNNEYVSLDPKVDPKDFKLKLSPLKMEMGSPKKRNNENEKPNHNTKYKRIKIEINDEDDKFTGMDSDGFVTTSVKLSDDYSNLEGDVEKQKIPKETTKEPLKAKALVQTSIMNFFKKQ